MKRISIKDLEPGAYKAMHGLEQYMMNSLITPTLRELIKIRVSQINSCAYCIDMHTQDALRIGETPRRIFAFISMERISFIYQTGKGCFARN